MKTKAHLALIADSSSCSDKSPTANVCGGGYHWPAAMKGNSPGLLLKSTLSSIWQAPGEVPRPWTLQGAGEHQVEFLEVFSKQLFHLRCCGMLLLKTNKQNVWLTAGYPSPLKIVEEFRAWTSVLFKAVCGKSHCICIFQNSRKRKKKMHFFVGKNCFHGKVAPHLFSHIYSSGLIFVSVTETLGD